MIDRRPGLRQASGTLGTIGTAIAVSSVLGYALLAVVARWLPEDDYAVFLSTWGVVFGLGSVLAVVEQEVSRQAAVARASGRRSGRSSIQVMALSTSAVLLVALVIGLSPLRQSVFAGSTAIAALVLVSTLGFGIQFFVRGVLIGHQRVREYSALLVIETVSRLAFVVVLALLIGGDLLAPFVAAVVTGSFAWVPFSSRTSSLLAPREGAEPWRTISSRVLVLGSSAALVACLLTGYPAIVTAVVGDTAGLATLFAVISATRVPLVLLSPVQAIAVPTVVRLIREDKTAQLHAWLARAIGLLLAAATAGAALGAVFGPAAVRLMFGAGFDAPRWMVAILAAATVVIAGVLLEAAALLAFQRYVAVLLTWGTGVSAAIGALVLWPGSADQKGVVGLAVAALVSGVTGTVLLLAETRRHAR